MSSTAKAKAGSTSFTRVSNFFSEKFLRVSLSELEIFAKTLSILLKSGMPILEALDTARQASKGSLRFVLERIYEAVRSGRSFSKSLAEYPTVFSSFFVSTLTIGEKSGKLGQSLERLSVHIEKERALKNKIRNSLLYPIVIVIAAIVMGTFVMLYVFPKITPLFRQLNIELPLTTRVFISISEFLQVYGLFFLVFCAILLFVAWLFSTKFQFSRLFHALALRIPFLSRMVINIQIAGFCRSLGTLLQSGVTIDDALAIVERSTDSYLFKKIMNEAQEDVSKGRKFSASLANYEHVIPLLVLKMITAGEESGNLDTTLLYLADYYEKEVDTIAKAIPTVLEPVLLLVIGLSIALLALAIMSPIFQITGGIKR